MYECSGRCNINTTVWQSYMLILDVLHGGENLKNNYTKSYTKYNFTTTLCSQYGEMQFCQL